MHGGAVRHQQLWQVLIPFVLFLFTIHRQHGGQTSIEALNIPIALGPHACSSRLMDAKEITHLLKSSRFKIKNGVYI